MIWAAPWVVVPGAPPIRDGAVSLDGEGNLLTAGRAVDFDGPIDVRSGVICPGFVNAHTHLELSHMMVAGGDGLVPWIRRLLAERTPPEEIAMVGAVAYLEARGTVAVVDISNSGASVPPLERSWLRFRVLREVVAVRASEPVPPALEGGTAHSTYATHESALRAHGAASIHVEEDPAEAEWLLEGTGPFATLLEPRRLPRRRPVAYLDELGLLDRGTLLVHMTCADDDSFRLAAERGATVVLCPRSNLHIGGRLPRWRAARSAGCDVAFGTDSLASSPSLDVLGEIAVLARDGADPAWLVDAATRGGARAFGLAQPPGWVEVGDVGRGVDDPLAFIAFEGEAAPVRRLSCS